MQNSGLVQPLAGRIALITGASRGIGAAVAQRFAAAGAHVVLIARTVGGLEEVDDRIRAVGGAATLLPLDLVEFDKLDQIGPSLYERFGRLDILVGNAGMLGTIGPLSHQSPSEFGRVLDVNLTANWRLIRTCDPLLRAAPQGRALFTTCAAGREAKAYWAAYAVAKAGLEMMVGVWRAELAQTSLRVGLIDPGPVATALRKKAFPGEDRTALKTVDQAADAFLDAVLS